jgi:dolichol-phosphate mannosyltransferase
MSTKLLSVCLLAYYSEDKINIVYRNLREILDKENIKFEMIITDDASSDNTYEIAKELEKKETNVRAYQLSRNCTSTISAFASLSQCKGDCAVLIGDDDQHPFEFIVEMFRMWEQGEKIVFLHRKSRKDKFTTKVLANLYYRIMKLLSDLEYPPGGIETFLIDKEIFKIINTRIHPINTDILVEVLRLGYSPCSISYDRPRGNRKKSRWTFKKKIKLAKNIFLSSSSFPIKLISFLGVFFSIFSLLLIIFYGYVNIFGNQSFWGYIPPGWTSTVLFVSFYSGLILFSLGIIAEYIWRIYEEVKDRPGYIIKEDEDVKSG